MATTKPAVAQDETIALPVIEPGAKSFQWELGGESVEVVRLKTGAALSVSKMLVTYLDKIASAWPSGDVTDTRAAFAVIQGIAEVFEPDDLISFAAQITGLPKEKIEEAPLEDTLAVLGGALDLNNMMRMIATLRVLARKVGIGREPDK